MGNRSLYSLNRALVPSGVVTATSTGTTAQDLPDGPNGYAFVLDVTAAANAIDDTLDVYVQTKLDGTNFVDIVHFTQLLGNGGAKRYIAKVSGSEPQTMFENGTALAAAAIRHLIGDSFRVRYVVVQGVIPGAASFTFSVRAIPI